ncbi:MAG: hypothetical protein OXI41_01835 [Chloroflexota bacterium]|nr:hypothetical protein [Chloroflexota bacterium]MDE2895561.1 hypothetical protein [Chloroflexota bacterium]
MSSTQMANPSFPWLPAEVTGPKLQRATGAYRYYAGYSHDFVRDILNGWPEDELILDPWNGSGATTTVAATLGKWCVGVDLNPAMVAIARASLLTERDTDRIHRQARGLRQLKHAATAVQHDDPLLEWFDAASVCRLRSIQSWLVGLNRLDIEDVSDLDHAQSYWLTVLFGIVRNAAVAWRSSNPTWTKPGDGIQHASLEWEEMKGALVDTGMAATPLQEGDAGRSNVFLGDSAELSEVGAEPHLVLGSPPYCTRIDYAMATRVELSVLGLNAVKQTELRRRLMGTTTVPTKEVALTSVVGETARRTLQLVRSHPSKASSTYYAKWLAQYIDSFASSLCELSRVAAPEGAIGIVVQGSYYKELLIDLPSITTDILNGLGWRLVRSYSFPHRRSLAHINPRAIGYRDGGGPSEHALFFGRMC